MDSYSILVLASQDILFWGIVKVVKKKLQARMMYLFATGVCHG